MVPDSATGRRLPVVSLYGEDIAICPRAVAGAAELAFGSPVIIEGEVELAG